MREEEEEEEEEEEGSLQRERRRDSLSFLVVQIVFLSLVVSPKRPLSFQKRSPKKKDTQTRKRGGEKKKKDTHNQKGEFRVFLLCVWGFTEEGLFSLS